MMDDYHIRKLDDGTWIVSSMGENKKGELGKMVEYSYDDLDDALEDIKNGFSDESESDHMESEPNPTEEKAKGKLKQITKAEED